MKHPLYTVIVVIQNAHYLKNKQLNLNDNLNKTPLLKIF